MTAWLVAAVAVAFYGALRLVIFLVDLACYIADDDYDQS